MSITCFIRYQIDPYAKDAFAKYAQTWGQAIPAAGANLIGYFGPHEGSATTAYGIYSIDDLAEYEAYRQRLATSDLGRQNYEFAAKEKFIKREDRIFLTCVSHPHAPMAED